MTSLPVTSLYAAVLAVLYLALTFRVIGGRRAKRIDMGAGDDRLFERHVRAHANFAEYAPFGLLLLLLLELQGWPGWLLHILGLALLAGRAAHAWSFSAAGLRLRSRTVGMTLTTAMIAVAALLCLASAFR